MNRREALKAITAITINGKLLAKTFKLKGSEKYVCFFDAALGHDFGDKFIADNPNAVAYPVSVPKGKTLDDAIRIFDAS